MDGVGTGVWLATCINMTGLVKSHSCIMMKGKAGEN